MSEPKKRESAWPALVIVGIVLPVLIVYVVAYERTAAPVYGPDPRFPGTAARFVGPDARYSRDKRIDGVLQVVFWPIHEIDIRVRPRRWHIEVD